MELSSLNVHISKTISFHCYPQEVQEKQLPKEKKKRQRIMHNSESEVLALANWTATEISPVVYSEFPQVKEDCLLKMTP